MKFKIGDIITGVDSCPYTITNNRGTYEVIYAYNSKLIRVKVTEHIDKSVIGDQFVVDSNFFVYAEGYAHWDGIFNRAYYKKTFSVKDGIPVVEGVGVNSPCYKQLCEEYAKYKESMKKEGDVV